MKNQNQQQRYNRALNLFAAEERYQELAGIALREATLSRDSIVSTEDAYPEAIENETSLLGRLNTVERSSENNILEAHQQLKNAKLHASHLAIQDRKLQQLNALIEGTQNPTTDNNDIIEGKVITTTSKLQEQTGKS